MLTQWCGRWAALALALSLASGCAGVTKPDDDEKFSSKTPVEAMTVQLPDGSMVTFAEQHVKHAIGPNISQSYTGQCYKPGTCVPTGNGQCHIVRELTCLPVSTNFASRGGPLDHTADTVIEGAAFVAGAALLRPPTYESEQNTTLGSTNSTQFEPGAVQGGNATTGPIGIGVEQQTDVGVGVITQVQQQQRQQGGGKPNGGKPPKKQGKKRHNQVQDAGIGW